MRERTWLVYVMALCSLSVTIGIAVAFLVILLERFKGLGTLSGI